MVAYSRELYKTKLKKNWLKGADVLAVQVKLTALGYYTDDLDGIFWKMTDEAVRAYQKAMKLKVDGVVGKITWGSLFIVKVSADRVTFCEIANEQVENGSIYVLGSQGHTGAQINERWIEYREHGVAKEIKRVLRLMAKRLAAGYLNLRAFDCSGLVMWILAQMGIKISDHNANGIYYDMCDPIERQDLIAGDLVFKKYATSKRMYHVGIYMGDGTVTHCKGRDDGVVRESINATGWNRYGRLKSIK